ncbi:hypothetical protein PS15m_005788 [Mucor circinelloides]
MARPTIVYDAKKSSGTNWTKTYKRIKELEIQYDIDLDEEHNDTGFALFFCSRLCKSIKNNHELFNKQKMVSEGDFLMKLWSLGLKGDTHLNNEIEEPGTLKFDLRVSNEASMAEFAKSSPGYPKYSSHRSKP